MMLRVLTEERDVKYSLPERKSGSECLSAAGQIQLIESGHALYFGLLLSLRVGVRWKKLIHKAIQQNPTRAEFAMRSRQNVAF